jgi:hypothetical protein
MITAGVQPPSASNSVAVRYRINGGPPQTVAAGFQRHDIVRKAQYFSAKLCGLKAGDWVDYLPICRCPGRQIPGPDETANFPSSFRVVTPGQIVFHGRDRDDAGPPPQSYPPLKIAYHLDELALTTQLAMRMAGTPADGGSAPVQVPQKVIWVDQGDEVLVHLDSLRTRIRDGAVLVSVDLETDQTGRTPLVVTFALGRADDPTGLIAVTDEYPRGNGVLASRWGRALQEAAWASLLGIATDHASERASAPLGIAAASGRFSLQAGPPHKVTGGTR